MHIDMVYLSPDVLLKKEYFRPTLKQPQPPDQRPLDSNMLVMLRMTLLTNPSCEVGYSWLLMEDIRICLLVLKLWVERDPFLL